jgi:regulatory protein
MPGDPSQDRGGATKARSASGRSSATRATDRGTSYGIGPRTSSSANPVARDRGAGSDSRLFADQQTRRQARRKADPDEDPEAGPDANPEAVARQICLRMLTGAPRTKAQLAAALRRRRVPEAAAEAVLARFAEVKLIDDAMFARAWVESRHLGRGLAGRALGAELRQRGVAQEDIQAALEELDPDQELATARELVARRLPATAKMPAPARMRRLVGMLARKGYGPALAYRVVRETLDNERGHGPVPFDSLADMPEPGDLDEPDDTDSADLAGYGTEATETQSAGEARPKIIRRCLLKSL